MSSSEPVLAQFVGGEYFFLCFLFFSERLSPAIVLAVLASENNAFTAQADIQVLAMLSEYLANQASAAKSFQSSRNPTRGTRELLASISPTSTKEPFSRPSQGADRSKADQAEPTSPKADPT
jgi:hypothetical protein